MVHLSNIGILFNAELTEIYNRYLQGKKPAYYNYKFKPTNQQQLLEFGIAQMLSNKEYIHSLYQKDTNNLSFEQWLIFEWFSNSLKGIDILTKVRSI